MAEEIHRKVQFSELQKLSDLDLGLGQSHTMHISGRGLPTYPIRLKSENVLWTYGWTDLHTYRWTDLSYNLLGHHWAMT